MDHKALIDLAKLSGDLQAQLAEHRSGDQDAELEAMGKMVGLDGETLVLLGANIADSVRDTAPGSTSYAGIAGFMLGFKFAQLSRNL